MPARRGVGGAVFLEKRAELRNVVVCEIKGKKREQPGEAGMHEATGLRKILLL
ncbi:MAG TPA: hypothetical protein VGM64_13390 [Lacunisphaera sp.]|jgi:hypothetical protein